MLKFAQALDIKAHDLAFIKKEPGETLRSVIAATFVAPLATLSIIFLVRPPHVTEVGLAVVAAAPAAPLFISSALSAGGRISYVVSLQFVLASLAMFSTPAILWALAAALGFDADVSSLAVAQQVAFALFLPTCLAVLVREYLPTIAERLAPIIRIVGAIIFLLVVALIISQTYHLLLEFNARSYLAVVLVVAVSLFAGQLMGPKLPEDRTTLALACAGRNPGLAMMIASLNFNVADAIHVQIPYIFAVSFPSALYVWWRKRSAARIGETEITGAPATRHERLTTVSRQQE